MTRLAGDSPDRDWMLMLRSDDFGCSGHGRDDLQ